MDTGIRYHDIYCYMTMAMEGEDGADLCATMDWSFVVQNIALLYEQCRATVEAHFVVSVAPNPTAIECIACAAFAQLVKDLNSDQVIQGVRDFLSRGYKSTGPTETVKIPEDEAVQRVLVDAFKAIVNRRRS